MAKPTYRCVNYGECEAADERKAIELPAGEETVCPECGKSLVENEVPKTGVNKKLLGLIASAVVVTAAGVGGYFLFRPAPEPPVTVESALREVWPWLK